MRPEQRIVTQLPLTELWDARGVLQLMRRREVGPGEVADLLRGGPVRFVVADCGSPLAWVAAGGCYRFWQEEVKPHLVGAAGAGFRPGDFPGGYCLVGSEWGGPGEVPVIVLEAHH